MSGFICHTDGWNGGRAADDERVRASSIKWNRLHQQRVMVAALDLLLARGGHPVVAEIIEAELAVRSVSDVQAYCSRRTSGS